MLIGLQFWFRSSPAAQSNLQIHPRKIDMMSSPRCAMPQPAIPLCTSYLCPCPNREPCVYVQQLALQHRVATSRCRPARQTCNPRTAGTDTYQPYSFSLKRSQRWTFTHDLAEALKPCMIKARTRSTCRALLELVARAMTCSNMSSGTHSAKTITQACVHVKRYCYPGDC